MMTARDRARQRWFGRPLANPPKPYGTLGDLAYLVAEQSAEESMQALVETMQRLVKKLNTATPQEPQED